MLAPVVLLWCLFTALSPFYVLPSGLPQPSDWVLLIGVALFAVELTLRPLLSRAIVWMVQPLFWFVSYSWGITVVWAGILGDASLLLNPLYYTFNGLVVLAGLVATEKYGLVVVRTLVGTLTMVLVGLAAVLLLRVDLGFGRATLFFNNPNQLGYFGLLALCIVGLSYREQVVGSWSAVVGVGASVLLVLASQSKAAMAASLLGLVLFLLPRPKLGTGLMIAGLAALLLALPQGSVVLSQGLERMALIGADADDSLAGRGYDRIVQHPEYLIFGAAEGAFWRFSSQVDGELHSSIGTLLFAYGIPGTVAIANLAWRLWKVARWRVAWLAPAMLYGLTHQGLRFRWFWVLLMMIAGTALACRTQGPIHGGPKSMGAQSPRQRL